MIIKLTLIGLLVLLFIIIATSYYVNKEGFDDITNSVYTAKLATELPAKDVSTIVEVIPSKPITTLTPKVELPVLQSPGSTTPERTDIKPEVTISESGYNAMSLQQKADLLKDIQKIVKNELLASRSTSPVVSGKESEKLTDSTAQGKEYEESCYKDTEYRCPKNPDGTCPPLPDMTKYIKKDEIPCWGCSIDY